MNSRHIDDTTEHAASAGTVYFRDVPEHILRSKQDFAIIDVETTGLFPWRSDRIIEFAVLRLARNGTILSEYVTLVNPKRDIGPTSIHGITARDVLNAPTFNEIAGDILNEIKDTVLVAHNVRFDKQFMLAEYKRLGCQLPDIPAICTFGLSYRFLPQLNDRRLIGCCAHCGIPLEQAHSALIDAYAVAALFRFYLDQMLSNTQNSGITKADTTFPTSLCEWPSLPQSGKKVRREQAQTQCNPEHSYISSILDRLPINSAEANIAAYLELLERVLEDRHVSQEEATALLKVAQEYGLTRNSALQANSQYLRSLVHVACADGAVSKTEHRDLTEVADLLGCRKLLDEMLRDEMQTIQTRIEERINAGRKASPAIASPDLVTSTSNKAGLAGKTVCFTGESQCCQQGKPLTRSMCQIFASNAGLIVATSVTKALDILVVADPDTMSGKGEKARRYGTRIIAEPAFWRLLGIQID